MFKTINQFQKSLKPALAVATSGNTNKAAAKMKNVTLKTLPQDTLQLSGKQNQALKANKADAGQTIAGSACGGISGAMGFAC